MYIKLKNKSEIYVQSSNFPIQITCTWCGKTIKYGKPNFFAYTNAASGSFCSAAHLRTASNAQL